MILYTNFVQTVKHEFISDLTWNNFNLNKFHFFVTWLNYLHFLFQVENFYLKLLIFVVVCLVEC